MKKHILIVEDQQDIFENIERKLLDKYNDAIIEIANNCDAAFDYVKRTNVINPFTLIVLDLTFNTAGSHSILKKGTDFLKALKDSQITIPTIVYSGHGDMGHIYPVMNNFEPEGYVIKTDTGSDELLFAIDQIQNGKIHYSQIVHQEQLLRYTYTSKFDAIDIAIIQELPHRNGLKDWADLIVKPDATYMSYTSIKKRIDSLCDSFNVVSEKQLVLKLQRAAII